MTTTENDWNRKHNIIDLCSQTRIGKKMSRTPVTQRVANNGHAIKSFYHEHCIYLPAMLGWFFFSAILSESNAPRLAIRSWMRIFYLWTLLMDASFISLSQQPIIGRCLQQMALWKRLLAFPLPASYNNRSLFYSVDFRSCCLRMFSRKIGNGKSCDYDLEGMGKN